MIMSCPHLGDASCDHRLDDSLEIVGKAENGIEAWALVKEEKPDILLLDVVMPRGDGLEVLAKAREERNIDTKFIMVSAVGDERTAADAMARGADYYIVKPFRAENIAREIKRSAELRRAQRQRMWCLMFTVIHRRKKKPAFGMRLRACY